MSVFVVSLTTYPAYVTPSLTTTTSGDPLAMWALPYGATLGSTVRVKGILQEARAHLPGAVRKLLEMRGSELILRLPA